MILITKAVVALHNFLMHLSQSNSSYCYCPASYVDQENPVDTTPGDWRRQAISEGLIPISRSGSNKYSRNATQARDGFKRYFMNEGAVDWNGKL